VVRLLVTGDIEMGHARALLGLDDIRQEQAAREIAAKLLNVRQAEALVRKILADDSGKKQTKKVDADTRGLQERLSLKLGQSVSIQHTSRGKGKLTISYSSLDELDGILAQFGELE
jgi:ParB family chromosome partitioning protein